MSGDVQPRKRKDKKKKRDDEDIKESHHGVHVTKMGSDDVHLHIHSDHGTGGHWCAKIFFFSLLAILFGLVGLIILENRGLSDLDTPLSESRFSEYFEGWVDEHRQAHDDHHAIKTGLENHDHEAGPFEEEEDHSEQEKDDAQDVDHETDHDEEDDEHDEEMANAEDDDNEDGAEIMEETDQIEDDDEDDKEDVNDDNQNDDDQTDNDQNDDDQNDEDQNEDDDEEDDTKINEQPSRVKHEIQEDDDDNNDEGFEDDDNNEQGIDGTQYDANDAANEEDEDQEEETAQKDIDDDVPFEEEDDDDFDDNEESLEEVVDNDAGELLHLRRKAEQEEIAAKAADIQEEEESSSAPLAVKVVVGLALALVARLVLVKKNKSTKPDESTDEPLHMKRRFTMISAEDNIPKENEELIDEEFEEDEDLEEDLEEDDYEQDENDEENEHLQYSDEEGNIIVEKFVPETFEQLNAMYRKKSIDTAVPQKSEKPTTEVGTKVAESIPVVPQMQEEARRIVFNDTPIVESLPVDYDFEPDDIDEDEEAGKDDDVDEELYSGSDDEEMSDVDDDELMKRLEEKYGKLPNRQSDSEDDVPEEPTWTKIRPNIRGAQSYGDDDEYIDEEIRRANEELFNDNLNLALNIYESLVLQYPQHPGALYGKAKVLDRLADKYKSNQILNDAIESFRALLELDNKVEDDIFRDAAERCLDRMKFRGMHLQSLPIHRKLMRRFSNEAKIRNQLAVTYLLLNRLAEAKYILHHTLMRWRDDGFAQVHYGFILKVHDNDLKGAVALLREGIASGVNGTQDGRFYFNLGDALYRLDKKDEAMEVYRKGAELNLFPSEYQRSLYNVKGLTAKPYWTKEETTYAKELHVLERNWELIRKEALSALNTEGYFIDEAESLKDTGDWKQLELFARGYKISKNCLKTPLTCKIIETFSAARSCKRGQVKFSVMHPGTHVWPHCGPTNCRLRAHLGLKVPPGTTLRVATENRTWVEGEFLIFDDSFEHEVWHNGTSLRLVLIVDVWHPELTELQRDTLSPI